MSSDVNQCSNEKKGVALNLLTDLVPHKKVLKDGRLSPVSDRPCPKKRRQWKCEVEKPANLNKNLVEKDSNRTLISTLSHRSNLSQLMQSQSDESLGFRSDINEMCSMQHSLINEFGTTRSFYHLWGALRKYDLVNIEKLKKVEAGTKHFDGYITSPDKNSERSLSPDYLPYSSNNGSQRVFGSERGGHSDGVTVTVDRLYERSSNGDSSDSVSADE